MKKLFLLAAGVVLSAGVYAQRAQTSHLAAESGNNVRIFNPAARTAAIGGADTLGNIVANDTPQLYYAGVVLSDSGFLSGTDVYGDMGYAERYDFSSADSLLQVTGVITLFGGSVSPASTKTVTFYTWSAGSEVPAPFSPSTGASSPFWFDSGFPNTALDSVNAPFTQLGISIPAGGLDTYKTFTFTTPTTFLNQSFFVGYTINYSFAALAGDTIGLFTSQIGDRSSGEYTVSGGDTIVNNQSVTLFNDGSGWHDNWADNFGLPYDFYIFPIVQVEANTTGVKGITKNNLTFFGNYPNPATDNTNIKFSLANTTDVTIVIMDMAGHTLNTIAQPGLTAGVYNIPVATADMPAGDYLYLVRKGSGDGMAGKMTVIK